MDYRPLKQDERELLDALLTDEFPGRDELRSQLNSVAARQVLEDGTLSLKCAAGNPSIARGLAVEGSYEDSNGLDVDVMLHVDRDGYMRMLEILKAGPDPIIDPPRACNLVLGSRWRKSMVINPETL